MTKNILISALALAALPGAVASAAPTTIDSIQCTMADADDLSATVRYTETASAKRFEYRLTIRDGKYASTSLRDAAGSTVALASASSTSRPSVTYGSTWSKATYSNLVSTLSDTRVQGELAACADPATSQPGYGDDPWSLWTCPIFVFIWDETLLEQLCDWF